MTALAARDYSLAGDATRVAVARGLAEADWYRPPIDPERLRALTTRTNSRAARDALLWLALLAVTGTLAGLALGTWWAIPAFAAYGALYGGSADSRWHEAGHGTAFKSRRANDALYYLASFMMLRGPTLWRWSHARHHTDTIVVGRDPEILFPRPPTRWMVVATFFGIRTAGAELVRLLRCASGRVAADIASFVPPAEQRKVVWEARVFVALLAGVVAWAAVAGSIVPLLYVGLPSFYGAWLAVFFGVTQHAGLREDVLDHRLNTWTVYMNPVFRFLYLNMNYHVEHHIFPTVPYHALPALHAEIKDHLAPAQPSTVAVYREILRTLDRQRTDPNFEIADRAIPERADGDGTGREGELGPANTVLTMRRADGRIDLGAAAALDIGEVRRADVDGRTFAVYRLGDDEYAVTDGLCTHGRAHLADGLVIDCATVECPKHNGCFDIRSGDPVRRPATKPLSTYPVELIDGHLIAEL